MSHPLLRDLQDRDPAVREAACRQIALDPSAVLLLAGLADALADGDPRVARAASDAMVTLGRGFEEVRPRLRQALHGQTKGQRWAAAFSLSRLEAPSLALVPAAVEAMGSSDGDVRWAAARLLVETARLHEEAASVLLQLVASGETAVVRRMATYALRELAPDHPDALRAIVSATSDDDLAVRRAALTTLARAIQPPNIVLTRLCEVLQRDADSASRALAAVALGELGAAHPGLLPKAIVAQLEASARDCNEPGSHDLSTGAPDVILRRAAARALERLRASVPRS